jgi:tetratricopeptide (TPR) repeat protein
MEWESSSPRRRASMQITREGLNESKKGFYTRAMKKFEKAIDVDPTNPYPYFHYGVAKLNSRDYKQSIRLLSEAKQKFQGDYRWTSKVYTMQAKAYKELGETKNARECYEKALKYDEKNAKAWDGLRALDNLKR